MSNLKLWMIDKMEAEEYISKVQSRFDKKPEQINIRGLDVLLIPNIKRWVYAVGTRNYIYLHVSKDENYSSGCIKEYCTFAQKYTDQFFFLNRFLRMVWMASTIPVIISESGFSDNAEHYVKRVKHAKFGEVCIPMLIDLKQDKITNLENFGVFGKPLLEDLVSFFRKQLSLEGLMEQ